MLGFKEEELEKIFLELDIHKQKKIPYTHFIASCMISPSYIKDDRIYSIFRIWDFDRNGVISYEDLCNFLNFEYPGFSSSEFGKELLVEFKALGFEEVS